MRLPWHHAEDHAQKRALSEAERRLTELEHRGLNAARAIRARKERNHWTETVRLIVRGG